MLSFHLLRGGSVSLALVVWTFWGRPGKVGASGEWALWTEHKLWNQRAVLSLFVAYSVPQSSSVKWGQSHSAQSHRGTLISLLKSPVPSHQMHSISVSSLLLHWKEQAGNTMLEINSPPPPKKRKKKKKERHRMKDAAFKNFSSVFYLPVSPELSFPSYGKKRVIFSFELHCDGSSWANSLLCTSVPLCVMGKMLQNSFVIL